MRALIVGGSLAGLAAAAYLTRIGWQVEICEKSPTTLEGRGAGFVTHPELEQGLIAAGCDRAEVEQRLGVQIPHRVVVDAQGDVVDRYEYDQIFTSWGKIYGLLRDAAREVPIHYGAAFESLVDSDSSGNLPQDPIRARFSDGVVREADLLIAADGLRSAVRAQVAPHAQPEYAGYVAWRGTPEERDMSAATHAALGEVFAFCIPPGEQMLGYAVAGANGEVDAPHRRYNYVWYRPADETELARLMTGTDGNVYRNGIAPQLLRPQVVSEMQAAAHRLLSPGFAEIVDITPQPLIQPIFDLTSTQMRYHRVVLIGDAAFVARPHVGMGVTKAVSDARTLARLLDGGHDIDAALDEYSRLRTVEGNRVIRRARELGAYMQAQNKSAEERAMAEKFRTPRAVLEHTATAF